MGCIEDDDSPNREEQALHEGQPDQHLLLLPTAGHHTPRDIQGPEVEAERRPEDKNSNRPVTHRSAGLPDPVRGNIADPGRRDQGRRRRLKAHGQVQTFGGLDPQYI